MSDSPLSRIRFPEQSVQEQRARLAQERAAQAPQPTKETRRSRESDYADHEAQVQSTLHAQKKSVRNGILLVLAGIAGLTGLMTTNTKPANPAYEASHDETGPGKKEPGKKEGNHHPSKPSSIHSQPAKSQKIEIHQDIPHEFFVMAEKMLSRGNLRSEYLPASERQAWAKAIVEQMGRTNIPLTRQNLMIILVTIDHETGFHESGITQAPEGILDRKIQEFKKEYPKVYGLMEGEIPALRGKALQFINKRRAYNLSSTGKSDFTERDVNLAIDYAMKLYESEAPDLVKKIIPKESLNTYRPKTSGCMEMNVKKAIKLAKEVDGDTCTDREMRELLDTKKGGLYYGMLYLKKIIDSHAAHYGEEMPAEEVRYVFADYNMGEYATRNAAIQSSVKALGKNIAVDGDLVSYDEQGEISGRSDTEKAIRDVLKDAGEDISDLEIHYHVSMEKTMDFEDTRTYRLLKKIFKQHGLTKTNVIPSAKTSGSFIKFGTTKMSGAGYAEGSYRRYEAVKSAMKALTQGKPHKAAKAKHAAKPKHPLGTKWKK